MHPELSVVTPTFNSAEYLQDALTSVARQVEVSVEHIVIDNRSDDDTIALLRQAPAVQWVSESDRGQSDAINKGFLRARGQVVGWLNADDYYLPGGLAAIARAAQENPQADVIYGDCVFVDSAGRIVRSKLEHRFDYDILLYFGCYIPSTATFFRRRVIEAGHLLDCTHRVCMDFEYFVRLADLGYRFHYVPRCVAAFRWHDNNISLQRSSLRREERLQVQRRFGRWQSELCLDTLAQLHRGKRFLRKIVEGTAFREINLQRMYGHDTRWLHGTAGLRTCENLACL
jgi:glycosyltransferase involved in cell wall biosynthesis